MVVDGRTELASPDIDLARLLIRSGKPVFLAVNKMEAEAMAPQAENFRRLGIRERLSHLRRTRPRHRRTPRRRHRRHP